MIRFNLGRVPVTVRASFLLLAVLLAWQYARIALIVEWVLVVFVSILVHELGHAAAARTFGLEPRVELHAMGGTTSFQPPRDFPAVRRIAITLAGPFAGFVLGGAVYAWTRVAPGEPGTMLSSVQEHLLLANLGWGVMNLLPIVPLDGGHVMVELLAAAFGKRGRQIGAGISIAAAVGLAVVALVYGWLGGIFVSLWLLVSTVQRAVAEVSTERDDALRPLAEEGKAAVEAANGREAMRLGREGLRQARSVRWRYVFALIHARGALLAEDHEAALEGLGLFPGDMPPPVGFRAEILLHGGRAAEAVEPAKQALREAEARGPDQGAHERHILDTALFHSGRYREAAAIAERGFQLHRDASFAYNAACSHAKNGDAGAALDWLERAVDAGWNDAELLTTDPDLAPVRALMGFEQLVERVGPTGRR